MLFRGFTQPTHNFAPGQMVYLRLETVGSGDQEKSLRVLDASKNEIQRLSLSQAGNGPFVFTASLTAPGTPGLYYLDIR